MNLAPTGEKADDPADLSNLETSMEPTTPRMIDRIARMRRGLEKSRYGLPSRPHRLAVTVLVAVIITGGLARLAFDDEPAVTAMPEPPAPAEGETGASDSIGRALPASLMANLKAEPSD